jgi:hypothetical protein
MPRRRGFREQDRFEQICAICGEPVEVRDPNEVTYLRGLEADSPGHISGVHAWCAQEAQEAEEEALLWEHRHFCPTGAHWWIHAEPCPLDDGEFYECAECATRGLDA